MNRILEATILAAAVALFTACGGQITAEPTDEAPEIFPDYADITIPQTIAPLDFGLVKAYEASLLRLEAGAAKCEVKGSRTKGYCNSEFIIPAKNWTALASEGSDITATVLVKEEGRWKEMKPFTIHVSGDEIDPYLTYRLIEPAYESWNEMGIYQRCLSDYTQTVVVANTATDGNCMNCHSFAARDASSMVFHMRGKNGGTYVIRDNGIEKLNTKTPQTISACVYPQWSADGKLIAFSVNDIWQVFHSTNGNRIEVYDTASDIVILDVENHTLHSCPLLMQENVLETYPTFSPDGKTLYFCSSPQQKVPEDYNKIKYSICSIGFDPETFTFGSTVDTLYNAKVTDKCATFPRVSPDGRWLMFTEAAYGCFSIWHKDADLFTIDLTDGSIRRMDALNSDDVESYHSWSSNSRWVVFSSRRIDGLYTRPFMAHIDADGNPSKPFLLPQKESDFYHSLFKSYNIPEFTDGKVPVSEQKIADFARNDKGIDLTFEN